MFNIMPLNLPNSLTHMTFSPFTTGQIVLQTCHSTLHISDLFHVTYPCLVSVHGHDMYTLLMAELYTGGL